jgi:alkanesulfonate monooxygenase SsuD/methylene tetrahydromethanopterin reductase-like flavin-dependent oxidoreductase (luciferase family)
VKFLLLTLIALHPDPVSGATKSPADRLRGVVDTAAELVRHYRQRWENYGHDPGDALAGGGTAGFHVAPTSQQAVAEYRLAFETRLAFQRRAGLPVVFDKIEDFVDRRSALIGSPQQVIDKVNRCHQRLGHEVIHLSADADGVTVAQKRRSLEVFQSDVAPVLRDQIASRPLAAQSRRKEVVL